MLLLAKPIYCRGIPINNTFKSNVVKDDDTGSPLISIDYLI